MAYKDILAIASSISDSKQVLEYANQLASQMQGKVTIILIGWQPSPALVDGYGFSSLPAELMVDGRKQLETDAATLRTAIESMGAEAAVEPHFILPGSEGSTIGLRARLADISIVARPAKENRSAAHALLEAVLFESGRPCLIVPPNWKRSPIGRHVMIAWKPTREAARAVGDAQVLIAAAEHVSITTVDASPSQGFGDQPGADIATHISSSGVAPRVFNLESEGRSEAEAILDRAAVLGADLIVMGGYGRWRVREMVFGGVTREVLRRTSLPVLMSH